MLGSLLLSSLLIFNPSFVGHKVNTKVWSTCFAWAGAQGCTQPLDIAHYEPSAVSVHDGVLELTATAVPSHGQPYTSGMVTTFKSKAFTYGTVSITAKLPGGNGTWPALWLLPENQTWPPEVDIMENHGNPHQITTTVHQPTPLGDKATAQLVTTAANLTTSYHTYSVKWTPTALTWYLDGKAVDYSTGAAVPKVPMYLLISLAIDGSAKSGSTLSIKSIRITK